MIAESADLEAQKQDVRAQTASVIAESKVLQVSVDDLNKERDVVIAGVRDGGIRGVKLETLLALQHSTQKTLEGEVASYRAQTRRMREELAGVMEAVAVVDGEADTTQARITNLAEQVRGFSVWVCFLLMMCVLACVRACGRVSVCVYSLPSLFLTDQDAGHPGHSAAKDHHDGRTEVGTATGHVRATSPCVLCPPVGLCVTVMCVGLCMLCVHARACLVLVH